MLTRSLSSALLILLVFAAAINLINIATNIPYNLISLIPIYI